MPEESNALQPEEISWLENILKRLIKRTAETLEGEDAASEKVNSFLLNDFQEEVTLLSRLIKDGQVIAEDRLELVLTLRHERKLLLATWKREVFAEVDFIDSFLKRLSRVNWVSMEISEVPDSLSTVWPGFRLSEAEAVVALDIAGLFGRYPQDYGSLGVGREIVLTTEEDEEPSRVFTVRITRIHPSRQTWEEVGSTGQMFEGDIIGTPSDKDGGDEAFGFLFPDGCAAFVDSNPDSDYTDRHICAALALRNAGV